MNVLLGICGGIAACKAPELVRELGRAGAKVRCIATPAAKSFCAPLALEILSGDRVYDETYLEPGVDGVEQHVELAQWAEVFLVAPATANTLSRLAWGLADDLLTTTGLMVQCPVVVAPAMHAAMWEHPAVRESVQRLIARGVRVVGPEVGPLASGEVGVGRLAELPSIAHAVRCVTTKRDLEGRSIVVSAGPTFEAVDSVRYLANRSSGRMGYALAERAALRGARVTLVSGPTHLDPPRGIERFAAVTSALEMQREVHQAAASCDAVIMAAAVADYRPKEAASSKLKKETSPLRRIELEENPDILAGLAAVAPQAVRVGFAAETEDLLRNAQSKLERKQVHLLVANDVSRSDIGFDVEDNEVTVLRASGEPVALPKASKLEIADRLLDLLGEILPRVAPTGAPGANAPEAEEAPA